MAKDRRSDWEIVDEEESWAMGADDDTDEGRPLPGSDADPESVEQSRESEIGTERNVRRVEETQYDQRRTMSDVGPLRTPPRGRNPHEEDSKRTTSDDSSQETE